MFTNYFIKRKIQALASQASVRPRHSVSLDEARSLLVFYNEEDHDAVMAALEPFRKARKKVKTCVFVSSKGCDISFDEANIPVYAKDSLNAWGFPTETLVGQVAEMEADILIDISQAGCYALQYIALNHPCPFKVGIKYPGQDWYDLALSITEKDDTRYLFEQILFYLRSLHGK